MGRSIYALVLLCLATVSSQADVAKGRFSVAMQPAEPADKSVSPITRMQLSKTYTGELNGSSQGEMLMVRTPVQGSAGYVALEQVTATLAGKTGTFLLQHHGIMNRGAPQLAVEVVPDSAAGELMGLTGNLTIEMQDGAHHYVFDYTLPDAD